jgi:hypothetical protein
MWIKSEIIEELEKYLFFANSPNFIVNGIRKTHILDILQMNHNDKESVVNEINENLSRIYDETKYYAYVYVLVVYLETKFSCPYINNFRYSNFIYLKKVLINFKNQRKSSIILLDTKPLKPATINVFSSGGRT